MPKNLQDATVLHNGVKMPWFGLGVWQTKEGDEVINAVKAALKNGYVHIDTAAIYGNEQGVGQAIKESGVARDQLFVTTKVWNEDQGYDSTLRAFETSSQKLGLEYIDLYLIHWPGKDKYKDTWRALEKLYKDGQVRAIGVSNFLVHHLESLMADAEVVPMVDQVEFHPHLQQRELQAFCKANKIQLEAWSPLMQGKFLEIPLFNELAEKYGKTPAQVLLRWDLQKEVVTIPKSIRENRIVENSQVFDFELSADDVAKIDALDQNGRIGKHPDEFF